MLRLLKGPRVLLRAFFFALFGMVALVNPASAEPVIGMSFPPVTDRAQIAFTAKALSGLGLRHIRIEENWSRRPVRPTVVEFAPLTRRVRALKQAGLSVLLTVAADGPDAVCATRGAHGCVFTKDAPFTGFVETLLAAVGDDIEAIQFGNEMENQYPGAAEDYIAAQWHFATAVRAFRPDLPIVLGGFTGTVPYGSHACPLALAPDLGPAVDQAALRGEACAKLRARAAAKEAFVHTILAHATYDIADIHLYDAPGWWPVAVKWLRRNSMASRIWVTEFGGPHPEAEPDDPAYHAAQLHRYLGTISQLPVERAYYFKLTDDPSSYHGTSGLYTRKGRPKPALQVFETYMSQSD